MNAHDVQGNSGRLGFVWQGEITLPSGIILPAGPPVKNIIPQVGINHLVGLLRGTTSVISNWYVGVGEGDFVPTSATDSSVLQSSVQESTAYSESTRPLWNNTFDGTSIITNLANRAEFSFTSAKRLYTGFLAASSTKGGASSTLLSIARFTSPYDVPAGSTFRLAVSLTLLPEV